MGVIAAIEFGLDGALSVLGLATGPAELIMLEAEAAVAVEIAADTACDPEPCRIVRKYWLLAEPHVPKRRYAFKATNLKLLFEGPISATLVKLFQQAMDTTRKIPAHKLAVFETCCRAHTAKKKADIESEQSQQRHKVGLINETLLLMREAAGHWEQVLSYCRRNKLIGRPIPGTDYEHFLERLKRRGFPKIEIDVMHSYGLTNQDIERVRRRILRFRIKSSPRTVEESILRTILSYRHDKFTCRCK